jgi:hypothetical protein
VQANHETLGGTVNETERRADTRRNVSDASPLRRARFVGGAEANVADVSAAGLFVQTLQRARPGTPVYLTFPGVPWLPRQRGTVARCFVCDLGGEEGVAYGVAVQLTTRVPELRELATQPG